MRMGTCLGFDFYPSSRTTNNPDTLIPTFGHYSSSNAGLQGPSTNQTSSSDSYTISPSNTTASNSSYARTYVNNFYQNAAYASTLIRAFDSYTSTDGGNTWSRPTSGIAGACLLPRMPPCRVETFRSSSRAAPPPMPPMSRMCLTAARRTSSGNSTATRPIPPARRTLGAGGVPKFGPRRTTRLRLPIQRLHPRAGLLRQDLFHLAARSAQHHHPNAPPHSRVSSTLLGITNTTDQNYLASNWSTWLGQGTTTGLTNLQNWLKGQQRRAAAPYTPTSTT